MARVQRSSNEGPILSSGEAIINWPVGRVYPTPATVPEGWNLSRLTAIARLESGHTPSRRIPGYWEGGIPWISLHDSDKLDLLVLTETAKTISQAGLENSSARLLPKDTVVFSRTATVGKSTIMGREMATSQDFANFVCGAKLESKYLAYLFRFMAPEWNRLMAGSTHNSVYMPTFQELAILVPPIEEQVRIAKTLSDADASIKSLEELLAKKRQIKQGAMQELLTGKRRLPGFTGQWEEKRIADFASPVTKRNDGRERLPVLTCSKHLGFVDSLRFFKNQVFSDDITSYKLIRRGQIGYPANHIEEGSIGLQDLYDLAVVSPIYVIFDAGPRVNNFFLHRLLKLDTYKQRFAVATSSSVDRRGSLRWPEFSKITVTLPPKPEQDAISDLLADLEGEVEVREQTLEKARQLKQAMMQELLTGRIRLA